MSELIPFAFEEHLVRAVQRDAEIWFVGKDVCACLGIRNHNDAMASLDDDERGSEVAIADPSGTKYAIVISEPGVYRLVFRSRKPEAERFKRWLAHEVLPQLRRTGSFAVGPVEERAPDAPPTRDILHEPLLHRLHVVREARAIHGREIAKLMWRRLGLPPVPPPPPGPLDEARILLRHILDARSFDGGPPIRDLVAAALEDDEAARLMAIASGVRVFPERDTFIIASRHPWLDEVLAATEWAAPGVHQRVLRRLPSVTVSGPIRMGPLQPRGTIFPADMLDT